MNPLFLFSFFPSSSLSSFHLFPHFKPLLFLLGSFLLSPSFIVSIERVTLSSSLQTCAIQLQMIQMVRMIFLRFSPNFLFARYALKVLPFPFWAADQSDRVIQNVKRISCPSVHPSVHLYVHPCITLSIHVTIH